MRSFNVRRSQKAQKDSHVVALLESTGVKAPLKMLMKLTPGVDFKMLYEQLLPKQILKVQKDRSHQCFLAPLGSAHSKATRKKMVK